MSQFECLDVLCEAVHSCTDVLQLDLAPFLPGISFLNARHLECLLAQTRRIWLLS